MQGWEEPTSWGKLREGSGVSRLTWSTDYLVAILPEVTGPTSNEAASPWGTSGKSF